VVASGIDTVVDLRNPVDGHIRSATIELTTFLDGLDVETYLLGAGVTPAQLERLRLKLLAG
jgi:hypothetical protein